MPDLLELDPSFRDAWERWFEIAESMRLFVPESADAEKHASRVSNDLAHTVLDSQVVAEPALNTTATPEEVQRYVTLQTQSIEIAPASGQIRADDPRLTNVFNDQELQRLSEQANALAAPATEVYAEVSTQGM